MNKNFLIFLVCLLLISGCARTRAVYVKAYKPSQISIPRHIRNLVFVDRSFPDNKLNFRLQEILESIFSFENILQDSEAKKKTIYGVYNGLKNSPRFKPSMANLNIRRFENPFGNNDFTKPLVWSMVDNICEKYHADALLALEVYDSDNESFYETVNRNFYDPKGIHRQETSQVNHKLEKLSLGWRIYDRTNKEIIDELLVNKKTEPDQGPFQKRKRIKDLGYAAGEEYANRIAPTWFGEKREIYSRGNSQLRMAVKLARRNKWEEAVKIWEFIINGEYKASTKKKAAYNIIVSLERSEDYQGALDRREKELKAPYFKNNYWNKMFNNDFDILLYKYESILQEQLENKRKYEEQMKDMPNRFEEKN